MPTRHGIFVTEPLTGGRPLSDISSAVIGLVATSADADVDFFPLNKPVLVTDLRAAISKAGAGGTLAKALTEISNQTSPVIVVVRVAPGANADEAKTNIIGGITGGAYTGMQALLAAEVQLGVKPRILGVPGFGDKAISTALVVIAQKLRAFAYCPVEGDGDIADATTYRAEFAQRELMLIDNDFTGWSGRVIAAALGLRARIDEETGWHKTLSNVAVSGVSGTIYDRFFDIQDASSAVGVLNAADVTSIVRFNGYRFWGNRTCSDEPLFAFESTVRTAQVLRDTIAGGLAWAVDKPLTRQLGRDIEETINSKFRALIAQGRLIGGSAWIDPAKNQPSQLAAGKLTLDYDYTPCAPLEDLTLNQRLTDSYYASFAAQG